MHPCRPRRHLLVHPVAASFAIHDADAFTDGVQHQVGLLRDQRALKREEIRRVGKDGGEMIAAEGIDRFVDAGCFDDITTSPKCINHLRVGLGLAGEDENFRAMQRPIE